MLLILLCGREQGFFDGSYQVKIDGVRTWAKGGNFKLVNSFGANAYVIAEIIRGTCKEQQTTK